MSKEAEALLPGIHYSLFTVQYPLLAVPGSLQHRLLTDRHDRRREYLMSLLPLTVGWIQALQR